jgi:hypothetical protein
MTSILVDIAKIAVFWLAVIVLHEAGHYLAFRRYKIKPKIFFTPLGIQIGGDAQYLLRLYQVVIVSYSGILLGALPFAFFKVTNLEIFLYCMFCAADLVAIGYCSTHIKFKGTLFAFEEKELARVRSKYFKKKKPKCDMCNDTGVVVLEEASCGCGEGE